MVGRSERVVGRSECVVGRSECVRFVCLWKSEAELKVVATYTRTKDVKSNEKNCIHVVIAMPGMLDL